MSKKLYEESSISAIANAIRNKNGSSDSYKVSQMASAILAISPDYAAGDEGKVVKNGALVSQTSRTISDNGTYDTTENNEVIVQVSGGGESATLISKNITQNGTYLASNDNADGYSYVNVDVQGSGGSSGVYVGTTDPDSSIGLNGDYYYKRIEHGSDIGVINYNNPLAVTGQVQCGYTFMTKENIACFGFRFFNYNIFSSTNISYHFYLYDSNMQLVKEAASETPVSYPTQKWNSHKFDAPIFLEANKQYTVVVETSTPMVGYIQNGDLNQIPHDSRFTFLNGVYGAANRVDSGTIYMADLVISVESYYKIASEFIKRDNVWNLI